MDYFDDKINNIDRRLKEIFKYYSDISSTDVQISLASHSWILLDSWIAWRTYRFLLRESNFPDGVNQKWLQTPSSFSASQLLSVWNFSVNTFSFFEYGTSCKFKNFIDDIVSKKRNDAAHFKTVDAIKGSDITLISKYEEILNTIFTFQETVMFLKAIDKRFAIDSISFDSEDSVNIDSFVDSISSYAKSCNMVVAISSQDSRFFILFDKKTGLCNISLTANSSSVQVPLIKYDKLSYDIYNDKGYFSDIDTFFKGIEFALNKLKIEN